MAKHIQLLGICLVGEEEGSQPMSATWPLYRASPQSRAKWTHTIPLSCSPLATWHVNHWNCVPGLMDLQFKRYFKTYVPVSIWLKYTQDVIQTCYTGKRTNTCDFYLGHVSWFSWKLAPNCRKCKHAYPINWMVFKILLHAQTLLLLA